MPSQVPPHAPGYYEPTIPTPPAAPTPTTGGGGWSLPPAAGAIPIVGGGYVVLPAPGPSGGAYQTPHQYEAAVAAAQAAAAASQPTPKKPSARKTKEAAAAEKPTPAQPSPVRPGKPVAPARTRADLEAMAQQRLARSEERRVITAMAQGTQRALDELRRVRRPLRGREEGPARPKGAVQYTPPALGVGRAPAPAVPFVPPALGVGSAPPSPSVGERFMDFINNLDRSVLGYAPLAGETPPTAQAANAQGMVAPSAGMIPYFTPQAIPRLPQPPAGLSMAPPATNIPPYAREELGNTGMTAYEMAMQGVPPGTLGMLSPITNPAEIYGPIVAQPPVQEVPTGPQVTVPPSVPTAPPAVSAERARANPAWNVTAETMRQAAQGYVPPTTPAAGLYTPIPAAAQPAVRPYTPIPATAQAGTPPFAGGAGIGALMGAALPGARQFVAPGAGGLRAVGEAAPPAQGVAPPAPQGGAAGPTTAGGVAGTGTAPGGLDQAKTPEDVGLYFADKFAGTKAEWIHWDEVVNTWAGTAQELNDWVDAFVRDHGYVPWAGSYDPTEVMKENMAARDWGMQFMQETGRPPDDRDYRIAWYSNRFGLGQYPWDNPRFYNAPLGAGWGRGFAFRWGREGGWGEPWYHPWQGGGSYRRAREQKQQAAQAAGVSTPWPQTPPSIGPGY